MDQLSPTIATAYLDFAGSADVRGRIRGHLGDRLVHEAVVGVTHQDSRLLVRQRSVGQVGGRVKATGGACPWPVPWSVSPGTFPGAVGRPQAGP